PSPCLCRELRKIVRNGVFLGRQAGEAAAFLSQPCPIVRIPHVRQPQHDRPQPALALRGTAGDPVTRRRANIHASDVTRRPLTFNRGIRTWTRFPRLRSSAPTIEGSHVHRLAPVWPLASPAAAARGEGARAPLSGHIRTTPPAKGGVVGSVPPSPPSALD